MQYTSPTYNDNTIMVACPSGYQTIAASFNLAFRGGDGLVSILYDKTTACCGRPKRYLRQGFLRIYIFNQQYNSQLKAFQLS